MLWNTAGMSWIADLRSTAPQSRESLKQDKKWFDMLRHSLSDIVQVVVKYGDDAGTLISIFSCVGVMLGVGLVWALIIRRQLTLAGLAIAPVFAGVMALQTILVAQCEVRNKKAREDVERVLRCSLFFSLFLFAPVFNNFFILF